MYLLQKNYLPTPGLAAISISKPPTFALFNGSDFPVLSPTFSKDFDIFSNVLMKIHKQVLVTLCLSLFSLTKHS